MEVQELRKATDIENRELKRRWVRMSVTLVGVLAALGLVVMIVGAFPQNMHLWISVPAVLDHTRLLGRRSLAQFSLSSLPEVAETERGCSLRMVRHPIRALVVGQAHRLPFVQ